VLLGAVRRARGIVVTRLSAPAIATPLSRWLVALALAAVAIAMSFIGPAASQLAVFGPAVVLIGAVAMMLSGTAPALLAVAVTGSWMACPWPAGSAGMRSDAWLGALAAVACACSLILIVERAMRQQRSALAMAMEQAGHAEQAQGRRAIRALAAAQLGLWQCPVPMDGTITGDAQWRVHAGLKADEPVTMAIVAERIHPDDRSRVMLAMERTIQERGILDSDVRVCPPNGEMRWLRMIGRVGLDRQGQPCSLDGVTIDQTARISTEQALARQAGELARSNAELEQFAYIASHDLQEPLRMIISYLQILEARYASLFDEKARSYFAFVSGGAQRMRSLINALLEYSRIGTQPVTMAVIDSAIPLRDALANLDAQVLSTRAQIHFAGLPVVCADRVQLAQLFQNLISNALKFRSQAPPEVRITARDAGAEWIFAVTDNGIGIDPKHCDRIFKIFQRLHADAQYPGSGIGLATCKKIVERHHGRITVEARPGEGSIFSFSLPKVAPPPPG
jgi:signal transduction histidine kinase